MCRPSDSTPPEERSGSPRDPAERASLLLELPVPLLLTLMHRSSQPDSEQQLQNGVPEALVYPQM